MSFVSSESCSKVILHKYFFSRYLIIYFQMEIMNTSNRDFNMESYPFKWKLRADLLEMKVRWSIFIITSVCAGLPALVWSVRDLIHHRKNGHRISVFIILLFLTDFVELFLSPYILLKYLLNEVSYKDWTNRVFWSLWWSLRDCGLLLNQLVALEGILSVKFPLYSACVFSSPCFIIFYILVFLCIIIGDIFLNSFFFYVLFVLFVSVIMWIISCGVSCSADRHSHTSRKPDHHILFVFILTLLVLYLPFILLHLMSISEFFIFFHIPIFLMSVRLISDPLLCVLVCRENLRIQTSHTSEETSLV